MMAPFSRFRRLISRVERRDFPAGVVVPFPSLRIAVDVNERAEEALGFDFDGVVSGLS